MSGRTLERFALRLAWQQTVRRARRSLGAFLGIAGALLLVLTQLGFESALQESAVRVFRQFDGEVAVVSRNFRALRDIDWFERSGLAAAGAHPAVERMAPLLLAVFPVRNRETGALAAILGIGIDPDNPAVRLAEGRPERELLRLPGRILFDVRSQPRYGDIAQAHAATGRAALLTGLASATLQADLVVVGTYEMGASIAMEGTLLTSLTTLASLTGRSPERLTAAVLRLAPGADPAAVAREVDIMLPPSLRAITVDDLVRLEQRFWATETPIGFVFSLGTVIGFVVCAISIWQVLGQVLDENLPEYAVLQTMGYTGGFFAIVVVTTALLHSLAALPPATLAALVVYRICAAATNLDMHLTAARVAFVGGGAVAAALATGALAWRRLRRNDPANLI